MPEVSIDLNMIRVTKEDFVRKAENCTPVLYETTVFPESIVKIEPGKEVYPSVRKIDDAKNVSHYELGKGKKICLK